MVFFTQITMEAAEDPEFLDAMRRAHIRGALVGVEAVTPEGLKDVYKDFNLAGDELVDAAAAVPQARRARARLVHLRAAERHARTPSTRPSRWPSRPDLTFAQFVMLTPFPGTLDFEKWARDVEEPRHQGRRHPAHAALADPAGRAARSSTRRTRRCRSKRSASGTQGVWDRVLQPAARLGSARASSSRCKARLAFVLISKLYRQMYANTGIATDSARVQRSAKTARLLGLAAKQLFRGSPMPGLKMPVPVPVVAHPTQQQAS